MKKKKYLRIGIIVGAIIIVVVSIIVVNGIRANNAAQSEYQTEAASIGDISIMVSATGAVRANQSANLIWQTSGKVSDIHVAKGQLVEEDAILAELASTSVSQNIILARVDLITAEEALDKAINNSEARANAHLVLIQAEQALDDAEDESASKLFQRASQETIDIAKANLINANDALDKAEDLYERTRGSGEDSVVYAAGLSQYAKARQDQQSAEYNLRFVQDLPDPLTVEEVNAKLEQAKALYLTAKQDWEKVKDGPNEEDVLAAQARVDSAQAALDMANLSAPFDGTVTDIENKVGDLVSTGSKGFQLDDLSHLLVDVEVSEVDINQVSIDQVVEITFDAIQDQIFDGVVTDISMFGANTTGSVNFIVTAEIDDPTVLIRPGMTAAVNIEVEQLQGVLLVPSRAVRTLNDNRVVYVMKGTSPMPVEITLGASANAYSQIVSGDISEGDMIVLNPPATLQGFGPPSSGMGGGGMQ
ncbi:MAG: efflux RND transporter periplasmic adaptor subunit [Anaerolineaceae bacterium]|nr:efflux RND transporter periplasmic adaptor subunit [Anaerolineaceae bacterium]